MTREFHYTWEWQLESSPEELWPLVSDTNRFNRDTGLPPMKILDQHNGVFRLRYQMPLPFIEWEEQPFEWVYPRSFGILRNYRKGPLKKMLTVLTLEPGESHGSQLKYEVQVQPANWIGTLAIPLVIGVVSAKRFEATYRRYDRSVQMGKDIRGKSHRRRLGSTGQGRLRSALDTITKRGFEPILFEYLVEFLETADDLSVQRMKPFVLADHWDQPRRAVLEMFLHATQLGILDMYWELLCPECRRLAKSNPSLGEVQSSAYCYTCEIDFKAKFDQNVEVIFRPNPSVRAIDDSVQYCVGSPQHQTHIVMSQQVSPLLEAPELVHLETGRYNIRASGVPGVQVLSASPGGPAESILRVSNFGWPDEKISVGLQPKLRLVNATESPQTFQLERTAWSDQAATAADVTVLQVFRDLFAEDVLLRGEEISVGSVTIMFTDLRESTRLYRNMGDASAFVHVQEHFDKLKQAVSENGGSVVKTMGDAIMASFLEPVSALQAVTQTQEAIAKQGTPPLRIKIGIHHGPCLVVNLNDRLDYFGSMVNIAARLTEFSTGDEAVISDSVFEDEGVQTWLYTQSRRSENTVVKIKGFEEPIKIWKIT